MYEEKVRSHYVGDHGRKYHAGFDIPPAALPWVGRLRAEKFRRDISSEDVVLEYGVGAGWNLAAVKCRRRLGFDIGEHLAPQVEDLGITFIPNTRDLADGVVDVVLCHHVLEHVLNPPDAIGEMRRVLRQNGKLLLCVPYETQKKFRRFERGEINHHLYSWNVQTLSNLLEDVGFKVTSAGIGEYGYDRFASVVACRLRMGEAAFRMIRSAVHLIRPGREVRVVAEKTAAAAC